MDNEHACFWCQQGDKIFVPATYVVSLSPVLEYLACITHAELSIMGGFQIRPLTRESIVDKRRRQEVLEAVMSYALSNVSDLNDSFADEGVSQETGDNILYVRSRYIAPLTEEEVQQILDQLLEKEDEDGI